MNSNTICNLGETPWEKYFRSDGILSEHDYKCLVFKVLNNISPNCVPTRMQAISNIRKWQNELAEEQRQNAMLTYVVLRLWSNDGLPEEFRCPIVGKFDSEVMAEAVRVSLSI